MYPQRPALLVPTFIGAFVGAEDRLPEWQHAFKDPRAAEATGSHGPSIARTSRVRG